MALSSLVPANSVTCRLKLPFLHITEPTITPLSYTWTNKSSGQIPLTVIGDVENDAPLPGVLIVAPTVGGGFFLVASRPYDPGCGFGVGKAVIADDVTAWNDNKTDRNTPVIIRSVRRVLK